MPQLSKLDIGAALGGKKLSPADTAKAEKKLYDKIKWQHSSKQKHVDIKSSTNLPLEKQPDGSIKYDPRNAVTLPALQEIQPDGSIKRDLENNIND